ncbi:unnamed protein product, partial [Effrenium voratum]
RSPPGRDVHVGFPHQETPKSMLSPSSESESAGPGSSIEVPASLKGLAESIAHSSGHKGEVLVAGMRLEDFWQRLLALESKGKAGSALSRGEKLLRFRQRYSWPSSISAQRVEKALRSGANVYLPPRWVGDSPVIIFIAQKVNTRLCAMEEYQMLIMFMLETAFRDSNPDQDRGVTVVLDVRHLSSVVWQACLSGFSDMARGIAMCSAALPMKASQVQLIEDEAGARAAHYAVGLILSKLSSKTRSRVTRGGPQAALEGLGKEMLPDFLGGLRDSKAEFSDWLEQLELDARQVSI